LATPSLQLPSDTISAEDLLVWAYEQFGDGLCLTCSWQKQSSVLVHMVSELGLPIDVIELDHVDREPELRDHVHEHG
jgi:3'-phosphoadenosine 5'-phosphosulfate sulfotransferase (PAPS reductase)/FAD synthetase